LLRDRIAELHRRSPGIAHQQPGERELVVLLYGGEAGRDRAGDRCLLQVRRFRARLRNCRADRPHVAGRSLDGAANIEDRPVEISAVVPRSGACLSGNVCRGACRAAIHGRGPCLSAPFGRGILRCRRLLRGACSPRQPAHLSGARSRFEARGGFGMKLTYFKGRVPNFGDELNTYLWPRLLPPGFLDEDDNELFLGIGSILWEHHPKEARKYVLGSGYGGYAPAPDVHDGTWNVIFVRGPRTAARLGLPSSKGICDSAILLRKIDLPPAAEDVGVAFMPHYHSF